MKASEYRAQFDAELERARPRRGRTRRAAPETATDLVAEITNRRLRREAAHRGHRPGRRSRRQASAADGGPHRTHGRCRRQGRGAQRGHGGGPGSIVQVRRLPALRRGLQRRPCGSRPPTTRPTCGRPRWTPSRCARTPTPSSSCSTGSASRARPWSSRSQAVRMLGLRRPRRALPGAARHRGDVQAADPAAGRPARCWPPTAARVALMRRIATDRGEDKYARATAAVALQSLAPKDFAKVARAVVLDDDDDDDVRASVISAITHGPTTPAAATWSARCARSTPRRAARGSSTARLATSPRRVPRVAVPAVTDIEAPRRRRPVRPLAPRRAAAAAPRGAPGVRRPGRVRRAAHPGLGDGRVRDGGPAPGGQARRARGAHHRPRRVQRGRGRAGRQRRRRPRRLAGAGPGRCPRAGCGAATTASRSPACGSPGPTRPPPRR